MPPPLIRPRWRRPALSAIVAGAVLAGGLAALVFHGHSTAFDDWTVRYLSLHVVRSWRDVLLGFADPAISFGVLAIVTVCAIAARRFDVAVVAVVGPTLSIVVTEEILKPVVRRVLGPHGADFTRQFVGSYPSGHETGVTSTALVLLLISGQVLLSRRARAVVAIVLALWCVAAAVGLVRGYFHYATDTIGALGVSTVLVLGTAMAVDRCLPARWSTPRRDRVASVS